MFIYQEIITLKYNYFKEKNMNKVNLRHKKESMEM